MPAQQQEQKQITEFSDLLKRNNQVINSICLRCCGGNAFYFDELRQECVVAIWAEYSRYGLNRFRGDSAESTWIYQIAYHAAIDYLRTPAHLECQTTFSQYSIEGLATSNPHDDWSLIDELSEHLNEHERTLLDLYLRQESYSSIARSEGITEANARKRMSRLLKKLKAMVHK